MALKTLIEVLQCVCYSSAGGNKSLECGSSAVCYLLDTAACSMLIFSLLFSSSGCLVPWGSNGAGLGQTQASRKGPRTKTVSLPHAALSASPMLQWYQFSQAHYGFVSFEQRWEMWRATAFPLPAAYLCLKINSPNSQ